MERTYYRVRIVTDRGIHTVAQWARGDADRIFRRHRGARNCRAVSVHLVSREPCYVEQPVRTWARPNGGA